MIVHRALGSPAACSGLVQQGCTIRQSSPYDGTRGGSHAIIPHGRINARSMARCARPFHKDSFRFGRLGDCRVLGLGREFFGGDLNFRATVHGRRRRRREVGRFKVVAISSGSSGSTNGKPVGGLSDADLMRQAIQLATHSLGLSAPHPNSGCVVFNNGRVVGEGGLEAEGTTSAEAEALGQAREEARGGVVYLNLEPAFGHGDTEAVEALLEAGVSRVVLGMRHPLPHHWGRAESMLRERGMLVEVVGEERLGGEQYQALARECQQVNAPLLYRVHHRSPLCLLKYAMTLDGKIAASTGHAAWVSSKEARQKVFQARAESDAVIVGGNTVRRDNPRLTTRRDFGHAPVRIVMSRTLRLPDDAELWSVASAPTIVMTQRGAREAFQRQLEARGVEVVEFDFLTPAAVVDYCYQRGFLQVLWECGGMLSAPAIAAGAIHKVMAFVAPKIIGGVTAPSPVGELGFVEMTQALNLTDVSYSQVGPDLCVNGFLHSIPSNVPPPSSISSAAAADSPSFSSTSTSSSSSASIAPPPVVSFFKSWDAFGGFSNFSAHPIRISEVEGGEEEEWASAEHFYQAQKFSQSSDPVAVGAVKEIREAKNPADAARIGRCLFRTRPDLVRPDWEDAKLAVMTRAVRRKFSSYPALRSLLLSTGAAKIVEASPHDCFWGTGRSGDGENHLGRILMKIRAELSARSEGHSREEFPLEEQEMRG